MFATIPHFPKTCWLFLIALILLSGCGVLPQRRECPLCGSDGRLVQSPLPVPVNAYVPPEPLAAPASVPGENAALTNPTWQTAAAPSSAPPTINGTDVPSVPAAAPALASSTSIAPGSHSLSECIDWRQQFENQAALMQQRIEALEKERDTEREALRSMNSAQAASRQQIIRLQQEVDRSHAELDRLESAMTVQQQSDLESLEDLSMALDSLLQVPAPAGEKP